MAETWLTDSALIKLQHPDLSIMTVACTDSTQKQIKADGILIANQQTAGIGRHGNHWLSPEDRSICFSYRFNLPVAAQVLSGYQLSIGLAIVKTMQHFGCQHNRFLKWPNDLIFENKKFAGILINLTPQTKAQNSPEKPSTQVTVGIGINWSLTQAQLASVTQPVTNIPLTTKPSRAAFISHLIKIIGNYNALFINQGLEPFLNLWSQHDCLSQRQLKIIQGERIIEGYYHGLNHRGELLLNENGEINSFGSGEVKVRPL